jgi:hypothetical protein
LLAGMAISYNGAYVRASRITLMFVHFLHNLFSRDSDSNGFLQRRQGINFPVLALTGMRDSLLLA